MLMLMASAAFSLYAFGTAGHSRSFGIKDDLYSEYSQLKGMDPSDMPQTGIDALYAKAVRQNNSKAECASLRLNVDKAYANSDINMMRTAKEQLCKAAIKYDEPDYYFYALGKEIELFLKEKDMARAMLLLKQMEADTDNVFSGKGKADCYLLYGRLYRSMRDQTSAINAYLKALEILKKENPDGDLTDVYTNLAQCYRYNGKVDDAERVIDEGLAVLKPDHSVASEYSLLDAKSFLLFYVDRDSAAEVIYQQLQAPRFKAEREKAPLRIYLDISHYTYIKDYDKALEIINQLDSEINRLSYIAEVEYARGNYDEAYACQRRLNALADEQYIASRDELFKSTNTRYGIDELRTQNAELAFQSNNLALERTKLALDRERSIAELQRANARNDSLTHALRSEQLETELAEKTNAKEIQEAEYKQALSRTRTRNITIALILLVMLVILVWLFSSRRISRKNLAMLEAKNAQLSDALRQAEESEASKVRFLQNMSHEIRTPLNAIVGFSQLLAHREDDLSDDQVDEFIGLIDHNTEILTNLIDDILSLAALDSGKEMTVDIAPVAVNALCEKAVKKVRSRAPKGVKLYYTSDVDDDYKIETDSSHVMQVLLNYLTNAEKNTTQGEIHLHASSTETPGKFTFSVTDTGSGVPADKADIIFQRFEKIDTFMQGSGLGLTLCRIIAERLGGEVRLDTTHTAPGSRFVFVVPLKPATAA